MIMVVVGGTLGVELGVVLKRELETLLVLSEEGLDGLDAGALRNAADALLERSGADIVVLASGPLLVVKVAKDAEARGAHAGKLIGEIAKRAGGGGGVRCSSIG